MMVRIMGGLGIGIGLPIHTGNQSFPDLQADTVKVDREVHVPAVIRLESRMETN